MNHTPGLAPGAGYSHHEADHFQPLRGACLEDETVWVAHHRAADSGIGFALGEREEQGAMAGGSEHGHL